jgi:hypothetical protein
LRGHALPHPGAHARRNRRTAVRKRLGRVVAVAFFVLVAWLVVDHALEVDWGAVRAALAAYPPTTLAAAIGLAAASHCVYACYDLLSRRYVRHALPTRKVLGIGLVSYAFNLNLGSLVGGFGFRWRLYSRLGLKQGQIGRIIAFSITTNWSGYLLLAGTVLALRVIELPAPVAFGTHVLQALGVVMMALPVVYVVWCARTRRRELHLRGQHFRVPSARTALTQVALSSFNWALIGAVVWLLLPAGVSYLRALATLLAAGVAGVITHVPGGLGVIEAVFIAVLGAVVPQGGLIAALLVYRAVYYLMPLAIATGLHVILEAAARRHPRLDH